MHKITVKQASLYFRTKDRKYLTMNYFNRGIEKKFMAEFNQAFAGVDYDVLLDEKFYSLLLFHRGYNLYYSLHEAMRYALQSDNVELITKLRKEFKELFGKDFDKVDDLKLIRTEIERYIDKYKAEIKNEEVNYDEEFDFDKLIYFVERMMGVPVDNKMYLYQFNNKLQNALNDARRN